MHDAVLVLGAGSAIARAGAALFAGQGYDIFLAGHDRDELERLAMDLRIRTGVEVEWETFNADVPEAHRDFLSRVLAKTDRLEGVLLAFGEMGSHEKAVEDFAEAERIIQRNYTGAVSILTLLAGHFAEQGNGFILGITSVAGERGRQSNYV